MMHRLIKTVALICPTEKVIFLPKSDPQSTLLVLKSLQLKLDQTLKKQYARKSQASLDKKINSDSTVYHQSRLTR